MQRSLARSEGLEPSTFGAEIRRSIQLNYERRHFVVGMLQLTCPRQHLLCLKRLYNLKNAST
jgi:hypothetical protein